VRLRKSEQLLLGVFDLSKQSESVRFCLLASGMIFFMCLYGYTQEIVIYQWFQRKQYLFTTLLYFLGMAACSVGERAVVSGSARYDRRTPWSFHILMSLMKFGTQGLANMAMGHINYPAKTLFKSAMPCATIFIGTIFMRKKYPWRDYMVVFLLILGLYIFLSGNSKQPQANIYGIFVITVSLFLGAAVPMVQEHCMHTYNSEPLEMVYFSSLGGTIACLLASWPLGDFTRGLSFMLYEQLPVDGPRFPYSALFLFCASAYLGAQFSAVMTLHFGALTNGITSTCRKIMTLVISFVLFPERNVLAVQHLLGSAIFFGGIVVKVLSSGHAQKKQATQLEEALHYMPSPCKEGKASTEGDIV
jgi:adenosine 3'-phospho 5'-phosphosulfate transporter B3